jgi:hypothetical protein
METWSKTSTIKIENGFIETIEFILRYVGPGWRIYWHDLFITNQPKSIDVLWSHDFCEEETWEDEIASLTKLLEIPSSASIDWRDKKATREFSRKLSFIDNYWTNSNSTILIRDNILERLGDLF